MREKAAGREKANKRPNGHSDVRSESGDRVEREGGGKEEKERGGR